MVALLARTARSDMPVHTAGYVFGTAGIVNQTGGWNNGLAFLFGLLSVIDCASLLSIFLILNRISMQLLISRKAAILCML
jgi:hypothetical protein